MESLTSKILQRSLEYREIICIYDNDSDESFWAAIVESFNEEIVVFRHFTSYGDADGLHVRSVDDIGKIAYDDDYTRAMNYLIQTSGAISADMPHIELTQSENWQFDILKQAENDTRLLISADTNGEAYRGFVVGLSDQEVLIKIISYIGEDDGNVLISLGIIEFIRINDRENLKRKQLYNWTKSL